MRTRGTYIAGLALAAVLFLAGGCGSMHTVRLWADATGEMTDAKHQWVYDGQPVNFVLDCPAGVNYGVFDINGRDALVKEEDKDVGKYEFSHTFVAGEKPVDYEVHAGAYIVRGRRDWYFDSRENKWYYHPAANGDRADVQIGTDQTMRVTCYRREVRVRFDARGGPPRLVELVLAKPSGEKVSIVRRPPSAPAGRGGFVLLGPDVKGTCEVGYTPTWKEVGHGGKTAVEVLVTHADGSQERIRQSLDTP